MKRAWQDFLHLIYGDGVYGWSNKKLIFVFIVFSVGALVLLLVGILESANLL